MCAKYQIMMMPKMQGVDTIRMNYTDLLNARKDFRIYAECNRSGLQAMYLLDKLTGEVLNELKV